jgi:hypothetical protein
MTLQDLYKEIKKIPKSTREGLDVTVVNDINDETTENSYHITGIDTDGYACFIIYVLQDNKQKEETNNVN